RLGPARVRYCASPGYLARRGAPARPDDLRDHDCIVVASDGAAFGAVRWPFRGRSGERLVPVAGRLRLTSFAMARAAALAGGGVGDERGEGLAGVGRLEVEAGWRGGGDGGLRLRRGVAVAGAEEAVVDGELGVGERRERGVARDQLRGRLRQLDGGAAVAD